MEIVFFVLPWILIIGGIGVALYGAVEAGKFAGWSGIVGFLAGVFMLFFVQVPAGDVGVVMQFGHVQQETLSPGLHLLPPFVNQVTLVDTKVQGIKFEKLGAASSEYQDVILDGTLNVHVDGSKAAYIVQNIGMDYADKIVVPFYANLVKEVVPQYKVGEVLAHREEIRKKTVTALSAKLAPYGVIVDDVAISNISFSEAYTRAIEDKQVQEQKVLIEQNILQQKQIQAQQAVVQAQGDAKAAVERARGQAEANRLLTESLSDKIIQYTYVQKLSDKVQVLLIPSDNGFIFNLPGLTQTPQ